MSLILDALRKSDHQRARNAAERLRNGPSVARAPRFPSFLLLLLFAVIALAATAIAVTLLLAANEATVGERASVATSNRAVNIAPVRSLRAETISRPVETPSSEAPAAAVSVAPPSQLTAEEFAAPPLASLPEALRARLPSLQVNIHAWAEDPHARFVLINLKRYSEGDRLAEGPLIRHILRDGVVLEFEGTLFSLSRR